MSIVQTPATARSDVRRPQQAAEPARPFHRHGLVLTAGALSWATGFVLLGNGPEDDVLHAIYFLSALGFQVGLLALLRVLWRTRAIGEGRLARGVLLVETGLVSSAMLSTVSDAFQVGDLDQLGWALLDACWPFSMLGMFGIGIRIALAGRWSGVYRFWPMVAESWALVVIPSMLVLGETVGARGVAPLHLVLGYGVLGWLVSRRTA